MNLNELWAGGAPLSEVQMVFPGVKIWKRERWIGYGQDENDALWSELNEEIEDSGVKKVTLPLTILACVDGRPEEQGVGTQIELVENVYLGYRPNGELCQIFVTDHGISSPCSNFDHFAGIMGPDGGLVLVRSAYNEDNSCQIIAYRNMRLILNWRVCNLGDEQRLDGESEIYRIRACQL